MITAAILIGLPVLIAFMLTMDDPSSKPRELDTGSATGMGNVVAFPAPATATSETAASETLTNDTTETLGETA